MRNTTGIRVRNDLWETSRVNLHHRSDLANHSGLCVRLVTADTMAESLFDVISSQCSSLPLRDKHVEPDRTTLNYLDRLSTLSLSDLTTTESEALDYDSKSSLRSLQVLVKRSYKSVDTADEALSSLRTEIPKAFEEATALQAALPDVEKGTTRFAQKYNKLSDNATLDHRKRVLRLGDNVDRISDVLELPALLSSIISASSSAATSQAGSTSSANANYATALDLHAHIRRLQRLYPDSDLVKSIVTQAESAMRDMTSSLISTLRSQNLKLAGGMRLIGLLRRVAPELDEIRSSSKTWTSNAGEGSLGAMFLVCRLSNLLTTLEALEPLQELADQDFNQTDTSRERNAWAAGQQTERYLKRYIEVFREQCFAMISMYKSIFPASLPEPSTQAHKDETSLLLRPQNPREGLQQNRTLGLPDIPLQRLPPVLSTFTFHIVDILMDTLRKYLPNVRDQASRDSLLTQVLYCSASLGRLGGDFSMMLALLEEDVNDEIQSQIPCDKDEATMPDSDPEWMLAMKKHKVQASRLELLASGVNRKTASEALASG